MPPKRAKRKAPPRRKAAKPRRRAPAKKRVRFNLRKPAKGRKRTPRKAPTKKSPPQVKQPGMIQGHIDRLEGPIHLTILDGPKGDRVVIMGDMHVHETECPKRTGKQVYVPVTLYLDRLFKTYRSPIPIDFFLEIDFPQEARREYIKKLEHDRETREGAKQDIKNGRIFQNYLTSLWILLLDCLQKQKESCEYHSKDIRFHYSDVRAGVLYKDLKQGTVAQVNELQEIWKVLSGATPFEKKHFNLLKKFVDWILEGNVERLFRISKIDHEISGIDPKEYDIQAIREIFKANLLEHFATNRDIIERVKRFIELTPQDKKFNSDDLAKLMNVDHPLGIMGRILAPLLELYTVARMFKLKSKRVIVYFGDAHSQNMQQLLVKQFGYRVLVEKFSILRKSDVLKEFGRAGANFQCIDMKGVPQPWFE